MEPLVFTPFLRPMVWGERRLATRLGKSLPVEGIFGESWEISAHASHVVTVAEGLVNPWSLAFLPSGKISSVKSVTFFGC